VIREVGEKQKELAESQKETGRKLEEQRQEFDRKLDERRQEYQQWLKKSGEEYDRRMKDQWDKTNKKLGDLTLRFGDVIEHLIAPNLTEKFRGMNFNFTTAGPPITIVIQACSRP
jgi:DNA anti-recombination protein RmuC